jgi:hypothetical protein
LPVHQCMRSVEPARVTRELQAVLSLTERAGGA